MSENDVWVPRCFGRDYVDTDLYPEHCKPCPNRAECEFFCNERKAKAVD